MEEKTRQKRLGPETVGVNPERDRVLFAKRSLYSTHDEESRSMSLCGVNPDRLVRNVGEIIKIDPAHPGRAFSRCREVIRAGGVVVYPTDTFYGLGADPKNAGAIRKLFAIKDRQTVQPILLLIKDVEEVPAWTTDISPRTERLMKQFWPGPLTLVFKARPEVMAELTGGAGTIGLRVPGNAQTRQLLASLDSALTGTSANLSGRPNPRTAQEAAEMIGGMVDLILDGGDTAGGKPSTVVDMSADEPRIIREGAIPSREILG